MKKIINLALLFATISSVSLYCEVKSVTTKADFAANVISSSKPSVVKFFSETCPPCRKMKPIFKNLSEDATLNGKYNFIEVNSANSSSLCEKYNVNSIPTFIFFKDGKEVSRFSGSTSSKDLRSQIETNLK